MNNPLIGGPATRKVVLFGTVELTILEHEDDLKKYGAGPMDVLIFTLANAIEQLQARVADLERIAVAGPGWVPLGGAGSIDACVSAGRRIADRVTGDDARADTVPIDPTSIV